MDSSAMTDLSEMLRTLACTVRDGDYVYAVVDQARLAQLPFAAAVHEVEGWTVVLTRAEADRAGLSYDFVAAWITLTIHSSLQAVGLTAAFSKALGEAGISCNVLAGNYHDHILVPVERRDDALAVLRGLRTR